MVISRVPPPKDGSAPKTSSALALVLVLALAIGIWLLNGRDPGTSTDPGPPAATASDTSASTPSTRPQAPVDPAVDPAVDPVSGLDVVALADLPAEASDTVDEIDAGPPYPFDKDGSTFGNFEGILPERQRGYYEEFTVVTPGSRDRGARRIVAGDEGELYWTEDHYASFELISR